MPDTVQIRIAHAEEAPEIASVLRQSFLEFEDQYTPQGFAATALDTEQVKARMTEGMRLVALLGTAIVGTATVYQKPEDILYIRGMAVLPSARGKRIGRLLLEKIESLAIKYGSKRLQLRTTPFLTAAIRLYERFGFCPDDRSADLFGTPLIGMTKELYTENSDEVRREENTCRKTTDTPPAFA